MTIKELREKICRNGEAAIFGGQTEEEIREVAEAMSAAFGVSIGQYLEKTYTRYPYLFLDRHDNGTTTIEGWTSSRSRTILREDALEILAQQIDVNINVMDVL